MPKGPVIDFGTRHIVAALILRGRRAACAQGPNLTISFTRAAQGSALVKCQTRLARRHKSIGDLGLGQYRQLLEGHFEHDEIAEGYLAAGLAPDPLAEFGAQSALKFV